MVHLCCPGWRTVVAAVAAAVALLAPQVGAAYTPHLISRLPSKAERRVGSGLKVATISAIYEVDTQDWEGLKKRATSRLALGLASLHEDYIELVGEQRLALGYRCRPGSLRCADASGAGISRRAPGVGGNGPDGALADADVNNCTAVGANTEEALRLYAPIPFEPSWQDTADLMEQVFRTPFCVNPQNTSLYQSYYTKLPNVFVTGYRDNDNTRISRSDARGIQFDLHVVGRIPVLWARFLNAKLILNGSIPLPLYQPEVVDEQATHTDVLNVTVQIIGVRQRTATDPEALAEFLPVCQVPTVPMKGCVKLDHVLYDFPRWTEYKLKYHVGWNRHLLTQVASDPPYPYGEFNISQGPWPHFEWLKHAQVNTGPWQQATFPQKESTFEEDCRYGEPCETIPLAPSPRHLHSAVLYTSWNFWQHAHKYLCDEKPECGTDCLTNLTCLGGLDYYQQNFYFRSGQFKDDDNGIVPFLGLTDQDCPRICCSDRRLCMRVHDVLGYEVPFDTQFMLVFGGKTYSHVKDPSTGRLIYHNCERIPKMQLLDEWRSCTELIVNDLWRYDILRGKWEFLKTDSALSPTTMKPVGYPLARFGHGAVVIEEVDERDPSSKRVFMYIYGGMGPLCPGGVCNDVWRYEIPWAAQAYFPKFPDGDWNRGNYWDKLKDCPFGGLYRHGMTATSNQEYIYVFGGQRLGGFSERLYRYRVSTDMWEDLNPYGRVSLTRLMYDYRGNARVRELPVTEYDPEVDVDCRAAWRFDGRWRHCRACPQCRLTVGRAVEEAPDMPAERGDFAIANFADTTPGAVDDALLVHGGYRTTWGGLRDTDECTATTTTTTVVVVPEVVGDVDLTTPVPRTTTLPTTTTLPSDDFFVVSGTFPDVPTTTVTSTSTTNVSQARRLQTESQSPVPVGPGECTTRYYFDDLWIFDSGLNQWVRWPTSGPVPLARKGHRIIARRSRTNDTQLLLFGGHNQDLSMNEMWVLDLMRESGERQWTRMDRFIKGIHPPSMSYHTMLYSDQLNRVLVFGGLHWGKTNLTESDRVRNIDRRCFKEAQGLKEAEQDTEESEFFKKLRTRCAESGFCCVLTREEPTPDVIDGTPIRNSSGGLDLLAISLLCRRDCESKAFFPKFHPIMVEGVWGFSTDVCAQNCSGHGYCDMSLCVCEPSWYGVDCSQPRCPGSTCYTHRKTKEQFCVECSQHGRCVYGECVCFPGWGYEDCSVPVCEDNCSSTLMETRGTCVEDFPVHQCHCFGLWSGPTCSELLCLNDCSGRGKCVAGVCECDRGFYGDDCSLFIFPIAD